MRLFPGRRHLSVERIVRPPAELETPMLRSVLLALVAAFSFVASTAEAAPIVAVLSGVDNNFQYSYVHTSTSGSDGQGGTIIGSVGLGAAGGDWTVVAGIATLDIQLTVDVGGSISVYDALGQFDVAMLTETATNADVLLGYFGMTLVSGADDAAIDGLTFYFENRNYGNAVERPNGMVGDEITLWGASLYTGTPVIGAAFDLVPGGRGIDLRLQVGPAIPEPGARPLYLTGLAVVGLGATRLRRR